MDEKIILPQVGIDTISTVLNITRQEILKMVRQGIIKKPVKGKYDLLKSAGDYIKYLQNQQTVGKDLHTEKLRLMSAQADIAEKEVEFLSHELVPAEHVTKLIQGMNTAVRAKLLSMPTKIAAVILSADTLPEAQSIIKAEINEALKELHDEIPPGAEGYLPKFSKNLAPPTESEYIGMG